MAELSSDSICKSIGLAGDSTLQELPLGGSKKLQIRAKFFNIFNRSSATHLENFGRINLKRGRRIVEFAVTIYF